MAVYEKPGENKKIHAGKRDFHRKNTQTNPLWRYLGHPSEKDTAFTAVSPC
jgi:hypothetical protein